MNAQTNLAQLVVAWQAMKNAETEARAERVKIEESIAAFLPAQSTEDRQHADVAGFRVSVVYKCSRKVDSNEIGSRWDSLSDAVKQCFKWSAEAKMKELRGLMQFDKDAYAAIAPFITMTPSRPAVFIDEIKADA